MSNLFSSCSGIIRTLNAVFINNLPIGKLLCSGRSPVLAPLYDALSTAVYPTLTPKMAMKIGGKYKFSEVQARHWEQLAESVGLTKAHAKKRILEIAELLPLKARSLQSDAQYCFSNSVLVERINALIAQRCTLTIRRLTTVY